eukprot:gene22230-28344_t
MENSRLSVAPFSSKRIQVHFESQVSGQFTANITLSNINNPGNVLTLCAKALVQSALLRQKEEYLVELFSEEEAEANVLLLNADNGDSAASDVSSTLSHNFDVGDCYSGVRKLKRCWLRNTSASSIEVRVVLAGDPNADRPSGDLRHHEFYVGDEVTMESNGHLPDATLAYSHMVASYNRTHSPNSNNLLRAPPSLTPASSVMSSEMESFETVSQKQSTDSVGRQTPQSILVSDAKRSQGAVVTRSRNVSFSNNLESTSDVAKSTVSAIVLTDKESGAGVTVFASVDQMGNKSAAQTRPVVHTATKDRPVTANGAGAFEVVESPHDKATAWGLHRQNKTAKSVGVGSTSATSSTVVSAGNNGSGGKSSTNSYANDNGVICGKLWGDAGLCQSLLDNEDCVDAADKSLSPAVVLSGSAAMEGGGISNKRFFNGKTTRAVLRSKNQKGSKKSTSGSALPAPLAAPLVPTIIKVPEVTELGNVSLPSVDLVAANEISEMQQSSPKDNIPGQTCAVLILKPHERRACTLVLTPSADYFDSNGSSLGGALVARSLGLTLLCRKLSPTDASVGKQTEEEEPQQDISVSLRFRVCTSIVTVTPPLYDLGLCSVGEFRWVMFTVQNDCDLPALVYSFVQSETLSIPEPELFIAPRKSKQLKIEYVAHQENTQYNKKAMVLNVFNESNHSQVEIHAKNVDTQQVLLHSLFYKLITYNNKRQLQVFFERGLINMPNLRTFCVKNTHSAVLRVEFTVARGRFLQLVQVKSLEQIVRDQTEISDDSVARTSIQLLAGRSTKLSRFNDFNVDDFIGDSATQKTDKIGESAVSSFSPSVATTTMNQHIEDLKWGDENDSNRLQRVSKSASMRMSGGGLDDEFHMTKSQKMSRLNQAPLSSDLDALDVNVATTATNTSTTSKVTINDAPSVSGRVVGSDVAALSTTMSGSVSTAGNKSADSSKLSPKVRTEDGEDALSSNSKGSQKLLDLVQELDKGDFPHCFLHQYNSNEDVTDDAGADSSREFEVTKLTTSGRDNSAKAQQDIERQVKAIQRTYTDLKALLDNKGKANSCLVPLLEVTNAVQNGKQEVDLSSGITTDTEPTLSRSFVVDIPVGCTFNFAVVLFPQQARTDDQDECHQVVISEEIQIRLPQITSADIDAALKSSSHQNNDAQLLSPHLTTTPLGPTGHDLEGEDTAAHAEGYPLKSRSMLVRAKAVRCEMIVIQKNISFGRTLVGDKTSRVVTVVNRSSIACLFSISKSGSISSGFLQIPQGRHGVIPAYSTKHVEFIFRPTLAGTFEETMLIENVLNPRNTQSIVVKAKVSKTDSFILLAHSESSLLTKSESRSKLVKSPEEQLAASVPAELPSIGIGEQYQLQEPLDSDSFYRSQLDEAMAQSSKTTAPNVSGPTSSIPSNHTVAPAFLGYVAVGEQCESIISFRIKNQTSKKRQFIVDSTHPNAVSLLEGAVLAAKSFSSDVLPFSAPTSTKKRPPLKPTHSKGMSTADFASGSAILHSLPFEPIAEILQSIVSLSCTFSSAVWNSGDKGGKTGTVSGQESLTEDQRLALEDSLEKFQQKLKIAVRKNKADKIEKYQKKINKVIASLTGVKEESAPATPGVEKEGQDPALPLAVTLEPPALADGGVGASSVKVTSPAVVATVEESNVAHHFNLEPDQEKIITVKVTFLPAASYSHWSGVLPFLGFLRVFECRNEDIVKSVHFGAMVYSSRVAFGAAALDRQESFGDFDCLKMDDAVSDDGRGPGRRLESKPSFRRPVGEVPEDLFDISDDPVSISTVAQSRDRLSLSSIVELQKVENSFLVTVAQWSSFPTKLIYPKYRQLPQNVLGMAVKLIQASKDRVMYGALSLASVLLQREAVIDIFVEDSFNVKSSSDYVAYNSKLHGAISFGLASSSAANEHNTSHLTYDSVGSDEAVRYFESRIQTQVSAGGKLLFIVKWRPPVEEQRNELNLLGAFKVQCRVKDKVVGAEQFVPFICVREHKSILRVERYSSFGDITVGSYRMASVAITNTSPTEDLHYLVSSEDIAASARAVGKVQINSGQTGVVPPSSSRTMSLLFSASAPGKFEQKLWIRNISDGFDQKRIAIQANVTITHAKFVTFPDLEHSLDSHEGKYKTIDLGLIQIQNQKSDTSVSANVSTQQLNDDFYKLRIENVSHKLLSVTAISNLKSQCFVYVDEACTQLAVNHPMPRQTCTILYVLIRPTQLHISSKSNDWISSAVSKPSTNNLAVLPASKTAADLTSISSGLSADTTAPKSSSSSSAGGGGGAGRELKGGIRLVFFVTDPPEAVNELEEVNASKVETQRKLFETALSFKAIVGKSLLKLKSVTPVLQCIKAVRSSDCSVVDGLIRNKAIGVFQIRNDSAVFPLRYGYVVDSAADCVGEPFDDWIAAGESAFSLQTKDKTNNEHLKLLIADTVVGMLQPGQSRLVDFVVFYSSDVATARSGLGLFDIRMINMSTKDSCHVKLGVFVDCDQVRGTLLDDAPHSASTVQSDDIPVLNVLSPIWLAGLDTKARGKRLRRKLQRRSKTAGLDEEEGDVFDSGAGSDGETESVGSSTDANASLLWYEITGAAENVLSTCLVRNTHASKSLTLTAVSDLPLVIHTELVENVDCGDGCDSNVKVSAGGNSEKSSKSSVWQAVIKQQNQLSSAIVGKWKRNICTRGEAFTLPPNSAMRVVVSAPRGLMLDEELVDELQRGKLESGVQCKVSGIVAFLQSAHSLQSLFDPTSVQSAASSGSAGLRNMFSPPVVTSDTEKTGASSQLESLFAKSVESESVAPRTSSQDEIYSASKLPPGVDDVNRALKVQQFEIPCSIFALGKLRGGYQSTFEITVVNLSEVDVPCSIECLPSWLTLHPSNFATGGAFYFTGPTAFLGSSAPSADDDSFFSRTRKNTWTSLSSATIDVIDAATPVKRGTGASSLGAKKMQLWENKSAAPSGASTSPEVSSQQHGSVGNLSDLSSLAIHQRRFLQNLDEFGLDPVLPNLSSTSSGDFKLRSNDEDDRDGEDEDVRSITSLDVHHESVFAASLIDAIGSLDAELLPHRYREGTTLFSAGRSSRTTIKLIARAPFVESQRLEHKIRIKNLTSCSNPYFTSSSDFEVLVRLDADSTKAVEVSGGPNDPLVVSTVRHRSITTSTPILSPKAAGESGSMFSPQRNPVISPAVINNSQSTIMYRLLKDPFLVPPPVVAGHSAAESNLEGSVVASPNRSTDQQHDGNEDVQTVVKQNAGQVPSLARTIFKLASEAKTHCVVFLKNNLSKTVRVTVVLALNPAVARVLSMHVKFPQSGDQGDCLVLQPKETAEVKIRISSRIGSRFCDIDSSQLMTYLFSNVSTDNSSDRASKPENTDASQSLSTCGPILFGTVKFLPSVTHNSLSVPLAKEQSKSSDLTVITTDGGGGGVETGRLPTREPSALSITAMSESQDDALEAPQDLVSVDIVGFLSAGPTVAVNRLVKQPIGGLGASTNDLGDLLVFRVIEDAPQMVGSAARRFRLGGDEQYFYINNPSPTAALNFSIKSGSYRHPGMQLFLPDGPGSANRPSDSPQSSSQQEQEQEGYYDTVTVQATPSRGSIPPGSSLLIAARMLPGVSGGSVRAASTMTSISDIPDKLIRALARGEKKSPSAAAESSGGANDSEGADKVDTVVLACMPLQISDEDWPQHPARRVFTYLVSDSITSTTESIPTALNGAKRPAVSSNQNSDSWSSGEKEVSICDSNLLLSVEDPAKPKLTSSDTLVLKDQPSTPLPSFPQIRLRGVTPLVSKVADGSCYLIDLKQQSQRKESIEWLVSVENCGPAASAVPYSVFASDQSWLTVGQSKGSAAVGSTSDIMVYLSRAVVGSFCAYVVVRNGMDASNSQVICVCMEVVSVSETNTALRKASVTSNPQVTSAAGVDIGTESAPSQEASPPPPPPPLIVDVSTLKVAADGFRAPPLFRYRLLSSSTGQELVCSSNNRTTSSVDILVTDKSPSFTLELTSDCDMPLTAVVSSNADLLSIPSGTVNIDARHTVSIQCLVPNERLTESQGSVEAEIRIELPLFGEVYEIRACLNRTDVAICT